MTAGIGLPVRGEAQPLGREGRSEEKKKIQAQEIRDSVKTGEV